MNYKKIRLVISSILIIIFIIIIFLPNLLASSPEVKVRLSKMLDPYLYSILFIIACLEIYDIIKYFKDKS